MDLFRLLMRDTNAVDLGSSVRAGLKATPKVLEPRFFYDALGSSLFEAITHLPEYYVTRAESEILGMHAAEIATAFDSPARIVELGSGSARKTRFLLDRLAQQQSADIGNELHAVVEQFACHGRLCGVIAP